MRAARVPVFALALLAALAPAAQGEPKPTTAAARAPLAIFSTTYAHDAEHRARAFNVQLAAEAIDGKVILPGATLSFNDTVGERTAAFGYEKSIVLRDHMLAEGTGGGTCQVASTLHAAALLAGLDIVARAPHSRPSAYIRMGLDATVVFPKVDLKLKNPRADKVTVHARALRGTLDVWLDAEGPKPAVTLTSEIVERLPFERTTERLAKGAPPLPPDTVRVKAFGIPGFKVQRTRVVHAHDGTERRDVRIDEYPPTTEVLVVPPTFEDGADLPPKRDDTGVVPPTALQLRPSTRVVLDNAPPAGP
jgi:hypothetical protein